MISFRSFFRYCAPKKGCKIFKEKLEIDKSYFMEKVRPQLMPSFIRRKIRNHSAMDQNRTNGELDKLLERQDRPLRYGSLSMFL